MFESQSVSTTPKPSKDASYEVTRDAQVFRMSATKTGNKATNHSSSRRQEGHNGARLPFMEVMNL